MKDKINISMQKIKEIVISQKKQSDVGHLYVQIKENVKQPPDNRGIASDGLNPENSVSNISCPKGSHYKPNFHVSKASSSTSSARTFSFLEFKTIPLVYIKASKPTTCMLAPLPSNVHKELLPTVGLQWRWSAQDPLRCYE